jgi:hypothetical protein
MESKARQQGALYCAQIVQIKLRKLLGNAEIATRGGDKRRLTRAARGSTGTLAAHRAGEERRGRRRHPSRGRSGLHFVCGGGQTPQDGVHVSNMDGEGDLSTSGGQQLAHMHPFRGDCLLGELRQEGRGVAAESTKFRDCKGSEVDVWATPHPLRVLLELGLSAAYSDFGTRETGG